MVELFARTPDGLEIAEDSPLTPIPLNEAVSSLSAILLDTDYYDFIMARRRVEAGLSWVGEDRQIPLKAVAWQEISTSKEVGVIPSTRKMCGNTLAISFACRNCWRKIRASK